MFAHRYFLGIAKIRLELLHMFALTVYAKFFAIFAFYVSICLYFAFFGVGVGLIQNVGYNLSFN